MVSVVNLLQPYKLVYVLSVVLQAALTLLKTQFWLTATYDHNVLSEIVYFSVAFFPFFFLFSPLTGSLCCADLADIPAKDGPSSDKNPTRRHQEQRSAHGL